MKQFVSMTVIFWFVLLVGCNAQPLPTPTPAPTNAPVSTATPFPKLTDVQYFEQGETAYSKGNYQESVTNYDKAIALNPKYARAYNNRGLAYNSLGNYQQAIADYDKAIELNPDSADTYNQRGLAYHNIGNYEKAITDYSKAIELSPKSVIPYTNRGIAYTKLKDYEKAMADYATAMAIDVDFADIYFARGLTFKAQAEKEKAVADFNHVLELTKDSRLQALAQKQLQELGAVEIKFTTFNHSSGAFRVDVPTTALPTAKEKSQGIGVVFSDGTTEGKSLIMVSLNEVKPPDATKFIESVPQMLKGLSFLSSYKVSKSEAEDNHFVASFDYASPAFGDGKGGLAVLPQGENFYMVMVFSFKGDNFESTWQTVLKSFKVLK